MADNKSDNTHGGHGHGGHGHGGHAHGGHDHGGHDHGEHEEHIHSQRHYINVWLALVGLFFVSVIGPTLGIKIVTLITAFGIAVVKASMVVKYFMHLDIEKRFVHYFLATSLVFMFLFFAGVAPDVLNHEGTNWVNVNAKRTTAEVEAAAAAGTLEHHGDGGHTEGGQPEGGQPEGGQPQGGNPEGGHGAGAGH